MQRGQIRTQAAARGHIRGHQGHITGTHRANGQVVGGNGLQLCVGKFQAGRGVVADGADVDAVPGIVRLQDHRLTGGGDHTIQGHVVSANGQGAGR